MLTAEELRRIYIEDMGRYNENPLLLNASVEFDEAGILLFKALMDQVNEIDTSLDESKRSLNIMFAYSRDMNTETVESEAIIKLNESNKPVHVFVSDNSHWVLVSYVKGEDGKIQKHYFNSIYHDKELKSEEELEAIYADESSSKAEYERLGYKEKIEDITFAGALLMVMETEFARKRHSDLGKDLFDFGVEAKINHSKEMGDKQVDNCCGMFCATMASSVDALISSPQAITTKALLKQNQAWLAGDNGPDYGTLSALAKSVLDTAPAVERDDSTIGRGSPTSLGRSESPISTGGESDDGRIARAVVAAESNGAAAATDQDIATRVAGILDGVPGGSIHAVSPLAINIPAASARTKPVVEKKRKPVAEAPEAPLTKIQMLEKFFEPETKSVANDGRETAWQWLDVFNLAVVTPEEKEQFVGLALQKDDRLKSLYLAIVLGDEALALAAIAGLLGFDSEKKKSIELFNNNIFNHAAATFWTTPHIEGLKDRQEALKESRKRVAKTIVHELWGKDVVDISSVTLSPEANMLLVANRFEPQVNNGEVDLLSPESVQNAEYMKALSEYLQKNPNVKLKSKQQRLFSSALDVYGIENCDYIRAILNKNPVENIEANLEDPLAADAGAQPSKLLEQYKKEAKESEAKAQRVMEAVAMPVGIASIGGVVGVLISSSPLPLLLPIIAVGAAALIGGGYLVTRLVTAPSTSALENNIKALENSFQTKVDLEENVVKELEPKGRKGSDSTLGR